jgi:predicted dehydrogenase
VVLSETRRHLELIEAAARAGKHVFVEKPLGTTAAESRAMAAALEKAGVLFNTAYFMRANPRYLFLREQVANGAFGRITRASAWNCHAGALEGWFDEKPEDPAQSWRWMANPREAGGGGFADLGTHSFDLLMWLFGPVESVCAEVRVVTGRYGECDDTGTALLRMRDGLLATVMAGWADVADPVALQIAGTEGHAVVFRDQLLFESRRVPDSSLSAPVRRLPPGRRHPLEQWLDALGGGPREGLVTAAEAAERVAAMEAAYTSARSGGWIKVGAA